MEQDGVLLRITAKDPPTISTIWLSSDARLIDLDDGGIRIQRYNPADIDKLTGEPLPVIESEATGKILNRTTGETVDMVKLLHWLDSHRDEEHTIDWTGETYV